MPPLSPCRNLSQHEITCTPDGTRPKDTAPRRERERERGLVRYFGRPTRVETREPLLSLSRGTTRPSAYRSSPSRGTTGRGTTTATGREREVADVCARDTIETLPIDRRRHRGRADTSRTTNATYVKLARPVEKFEQGPTVRDSATFARRTSHGRSSGIFLYALACVSACMRACMCNTHAYRCAIVRMCACLYMGSRV